MVIAELLPCRRFSFAWEYTLTNKPSSNGGLICWCLSVQYDEGDDGFFPPFLSLPKQRKGVYAKEFCATNTVLASASPVLKKFLQSVYLSRTSSLHHLFLQQ